MRQEILKNENNEITVKVELTQDEFAEGVTFAFNKNRGKYSVPGFRKGKAPQGVIERHYGEGIFYEDAANKLISEQYPKAISALELIPASKVDIDIESIGAKEGLVFTVSFAVNPEFELGDYKSLKIEKIAAEVDEAAVDGKIQEEREKNGRLTAVDRSAKLGDMVNIDFVGKVDGVPFDGGSMEGHDLKLGSGSFIPGFEEQLVDHKAGEEVSVKVKFPEDYRAEHLAGKDAVFECRINEVQELILPELDDDFAKDVSEFDTLAEYRDSVRKSLQEELDRSREEMKRQRVFEAAGKLMTVDFHERIVEDEIDSMVEQLTGQLKRQGLSADQYFEFVGGLDKLRSDMRGDAVARLKQTLVIERIMQKEQFPITDEEIEKEYQKIADNYQISVDTVKSFYEGQGVDKLKAQIEFDKVVAMLMENAVEE